MKKTIFYLVFLFISLFSALNINACTVAVITGKCTPDGRPILWKHRDTDSLQNVVMYFNDGKYDYIGLVDAGDLRGENVWIGCNSAGFSIMNSASYNLIDKDTVKARDREGILIRLALQNCATVDEFENFLLAQAKPLGVEANFGVIDAKGGATFFEVNNYNYSKIDVNDPKIAPFGYLLHTNFSFTGNPAKGAGQIRYETAQELFFAAYEQNNLTVKYILQDVSRSLKHSLTKVDLRTAYSPIAEEQHFVPFEDFIPRYFSSSSVAIQGVKADESPELTTMWTVLGFPLTSVAVPLWVNKDLPKLVVANAEHLAPLCTKALKLKQLAFPIKKSYRERYININAIYNGQNSGTLQKLRPVENKIFSEAENKLDAWRKNKSFKKELPAFYLWLDETVTNEFSTLFKL